MDASSSKDLGAIRETVTFSLEPILLELEGEGYMGDILLSALVELISGQHTNQRPTGGVTCSRGGGRSSSRRRGRSGSEGKGGVEGRNGADVGTVGPGGGAIVQVRYDAFLPALSLQGG